MTKPPGSGPSRIEYELTRQNEKVGSLELSIERLADLDRTIDRLFEELERTGEAALLEELCPYFGTLWPSARALALAIEERAPELAGRRLLELGCGLALPSLVAAKLGASVVATDFHPEVPVFLERNRRANGVRGEDLRYVRVDWSQGHPELRGPFDWIVGSDVLYERAHAERLAAVIERFAGPDTEILIADPARPYLQAFVDGMAARGFSIGTETRRSDEKEVFLIRMRRLSNPISPPGQAGDETGVGRAPIQP